MLPHTQLLAAHPQPKSSVWSVQSSVRYAAMRDPSTPARFASVVEFNVPCGAAALLRKSLQPYRKAIARISTAAPRSSGFLDTVVIFVYSLGKGESLERGDYADAEYSVGRIHPDVNTQELIPNIARCPSVVPRWDSRIQTVVVGLGEQVLALDIDSGSRQIPGTGRQCIANLHVAEPGVRPVLHVVAADGAAIAVGDIESRILGVEIGRRPRILQQILPDVRREILEDVEVHLVLEDLVAVRSEDGRAGIPVSAVCSEIQSSRELRMGTSDDCAIVVGDLSVAVHIPELDATWSGSVLRRMRGDVGCISEESIGDESEESTDRLAKLVDRRIADTCSARAIEESLDSVDSNDRVLVVTSVKRGIPPRGLMADGEVEALVLHLADVHDWRSRYASRCRRSGIEEQIVSHALVHVQHDVERALEKLEVRTHVGGFVRFPFQVGVTDRRLPEARLYARGGAGDVVERISTTAAELRDNSSRGDVLVSGDSPPVSE